jgi:hypothetical protein
MKKTSGNFKAVFFASAKGGYGSPSGYNFNKKIGTGF